MKPPNYTEIVKEYNSKPDIVSFEKELKTGVAGSGLFISSELEFGDRWLR